MAFDGMAPFAHTIYRNKYSQSMNGNGSKEQWPDTARRQARCVVAPYLPELEGKVAALIEDRILMPAGRYLYCAGRKYPQINNCFLFDVEDCREGWAELAGHTTNSLMTGGGVGVVYSKLRSEQTLVERMGGKSTGPCALAKIINEQGRYIMQGGSRRSALWAGLHWRHSDIWKWIGLKDWPETYRQMKAQDYNFPCPMDGTNISVILDDDFFTAYHAPSWSKTYRNGEGADSYTVDHKWAQAVYWAVIRHMLETGEPGFSVDVGRNAGKHLRNACTEVDSNTNCDMCNLLSINMARVKTISQFIDAVRYGTAFLLCGTLYSKLPVPAMYKVREQNRRIGLGLMGVHEWLLKRGYRYGACDELASWMEAYRTHSDDQAAYYAARLGVNVPVAKRSVAPTGTISIVAETTSGIEPIFAAAYKRRYLDGVDWKMQYVVDATAKRLIEQHGVDPVLIEDAYTLAEDVERRISFQAWMQQYVDHGISSTINLPMWGTSTNNESKVQSFGNTLLRYLPELRGITAYPDGSRGGQPLNRVTYQEAVKHLGVEYLETGDQSCVGGFCNS